ncbi:hypothetical protein ACC721_06610 [Rhizobium ruizarguesonis]|uniref:hypothetical protein n=1 Tax=Rhizobium ruizarguesonis TaxID=2081791 RepID=UPI001FDEC599|nr:hypothetical protein [Rhizobium ruizarguesonis]
MSSLAASSFVEITHWHELDDAIPKMRAALDRHPVHIETMRNAEHMIIERGLVFVHAGLRPEVSLAPQSLDDLMTIRH